MLDSLFRTVTAHIFHQVSVYFFLFFLIAFISDKDPGQNRILGNIQIISARNIIEPLYVLKVAHLFIDPPERLFGF
jgi:hypothetical protein